MLRFLKIFVALIASCLPALAQTPVKQSSTVTPTHATCWTTNGIVQDCGTAAIPYLTTLGTVYNGDSICAWSTLSTQAGSQKICLGATTAGGADISVQNYGTAPAKNLTLNLNGTAYQFPFSTSGVIGPSQSVVGGVAVWNNTVGTLLADGATSDGYFGSGRPWCDPRAYGAKGDNVTDDTAAFQSCINQLVVGGAGHLGGTLNVSQATTGIYCLFSGLNVTASLPIVFVGVGGDQPSLSTCGHDVNLLALDNARHGVRNLSLVGSNAVGTTHDTLVLGSSCTECTVDNVGFTYGRYAINIAATDVKMTTISATLGLGGAVIYTTGSFSCSACKIDKSYPVSTPSAGTNRAAWGATTSYSSGAVVSSGGYWWQAANAGTSGGSAPMTQPYGTYIQDNVTGTCPSPSAGVCWLLVGTDPNAAVWADSGSSTVTITNRSDLSGSYDYSFYITGTAQTISLTNTDLAAYLYGVYDTSSVGGLIAVGNQCSQMTASAASCFYVRSSDAQIVSNLMIGGQTGVVIDTGKNYVVSNNQIYGASLAAIYINGSPSNISIAVNTCGSSVNWGTNGSCVDLASSGSDYVTVIGNECHGATSCILNSSTGTHNLIESTPGIYYGLNTIYGGTAAGSTASLLSTSNASPSGDVANVKGSTINLTQPTGGNGATTVNCGLANSVACSLSLAGASSGATTVIPTAAASGTLTLPSATDTLVGKATADTLTNKTISTASGNTITGTGASVNTFLRGDGSWTAGTGAMTYLCTITASNSATLTNASPTSGTCPINSLYTSYRLVLQQIVPATNEKILQLQIHSGGVYKSTGYLSQAYAQAGSTITGGVLTTGIPISYPADANGNSLGNAAPGLSGEVTLYSPSANAITITNVMTGYLAGGGQVDVTQGSGFWNTAGVIDGFQVLMDSGNITSGSILVYGIQ